MAIKINSVKRWNRLPRGEVIGFDGPGNHERRVRLNLLSENEARVYLEDADGPRLLAVVGPGYETLEYSIAGKHAVYPEPEAGEFYFQTAETEPTFARVVDPAIFTKIANRRHRNADLEEMMYRMQANVERRLAQQAVEMEAAFERRRKELEHGRSEEVIVSHAPGAAASTSAAAIRPQEPEQPGASESVGSGLGGERPGGESD